MMNEKKIKISLTDKEKIYLKYVLFLEKESREISEKMCKFFKSEELRILEIGPGLGAISANIWREMNRRNSKNIFWLGLEKREDENYFNMFDFFLNSKESELRGFEKEICRLRNDSKTELEGYLSNINLSGLGENVYRFKYNNQDVRPTVKHKFYYVYGFDVDTFFDPHSDIAEKGELKDKVKSILYLIKPNSKRKIKFNVLFVPFILQHLTYWRYVLKNLLSAELFEDKFLLVSGYLSGDWETFLYPWNTLHESKEQLILKKMFNYIWEHIPNFPTVYRDFRINRQNDDLINEIIEQSGFEIDYSLEHNIEIKTSFNLKELKKHFLNKVWSIIIQNSSYIDDFDSKVQNTFNKISDTLDLSSDKSFDFRSNHNLKMLKVVNKRDVKVIKGKKNILEFCPTFNKQDSKIFGQAVSRYVEMIDILPKWINFGSLILYNNQNYFDYSISPFFNINKLENYSNETIADWVEYKEISKQREVQLESFEETTSYKVLKILPELGEKFHLEAVILKSPEKGLQNLVNKVLFLEKEKIELFNGIESITLDDFPKWKNRFKEKLTCLIAFPVVMHTRKESIPIAIFWFFVFNNPTAEEMPTWISENSIFFDKLLDPVKLFINNTLINKVKEHSIKSAISTIMSRNMSHNIGSHILSSLGREGIDAADDRILYKYLQHRMDYIAQISTEMPTWSAPVWFISDLMKRFYMQTHLLEYIGKSEELGAKHWDEKDDKGKIIIEVKNKLTREYIISNKQVVTQNLNDFQVAIPGGIVGLHAFYTILENIIRNSAKHNWKKDPPGNPENLEITIEFKNDLEEDFVNFRIYDNVSVNECGDDKPLNKEINLDEKMNIIFSTPFIDYSGKLNKENWGLGEMRISAGYLNQKNYQEIGFHKVKDKSIIIEAVPQPDNGTKRLTYEFKIPKPKELVIIGDPDLIEKHEALKKSSIYVEKLLDDRPYEHEIIVIFDNVLEEDYYRIETLPGRVIIVKTKNESTNLIETISEKLGLNEDVVKRKINFLEKSQYEKFKEKLDFSSEKLEKRCKEFKINLYKAWVENLILKPEFFYLKLEKESRNGQSTFSETLYELIKEHWINIDDLLKDECFIKDKTEREHIRDKLRNMSSADIQKFIDKGTLEIISRQDDKTTCLIRLVLRSIISTLNDIIFRDDDHINTVPLKLRKSIEKSNEDLKNWINVFPESNSILRIAKGDPDKNATIYYGRHICLSNIKNDASSLYVESLSGSQFYFTMLYDSLTSTSREDRHRDRRIILQMIENALLRYVIVDERAARYLASSEKLRKTFKFLKIEIPFWVQFFDKKPIPLIEDIKVKTKILTENDLVEHDIFIIHQGVLDKMGLRDKKEATEFLRRIKKLIPFVIVTSGRGKPHNTPDNVKFLPFSNVDSFLLKEYPEKILLTQSVLKLNLPKNGDTQ